jgi:hypothetical protein
MVIVPSLVVISFRAVFDPLSLGEGQRIASSGRLRASGRGHAGGSDESNDENTMAVKDLAG